MLPTFERTHVLANHALNNEKFQAWLADVGLSMRHPLLEHAADLLRELYLTREERNVLNAWGIGKLTTLARVAALTSDNPNNPSVSDTYKTTRRLQTIVNWEVPQAAPLFDFPRKVLKGIGVTTELQPNQLAAVYELQRVPKDRFYPIDLLSEKLSGRDDEVGIHHVRVIISRTADILPQGLRIESAGLDAGPRKILGGYRLVTG